MFCDLLLRNGRLWGASEKFTALAVGGGRIVALGTGGELDALIEARTQVIDLGGKLVTPGLWDAHIHLYHWSRSRAHLHLKGCLSKDDVLHRVQTVSDEPGWLVGWYLNSTHWKDRSLPTRQDLDEVSPDRPVILWLSDLHSAVVNTQALEISGLMTSNPAVAGGVVEVDVQGLPTGTLREMAANIVRDQIPEPSQEELKRLLRVGIGELHQWGITALCDQRIKDLNDGAPIFRALRELELEAEMGLRVNCNIAAHHLEQAGHLGLYTGFGTERLRMGHLKIFSDGTLGSKTARMLEPLIGEEQCGIYLTPPEEMEEDFLRAEELGFSVSVHSIGDQSTRVCLDLFEAMRAKGVPPPQIPHRLEHAQLVSDRDVGRFAELDITVSAQPGHALDDREISDDYLGERAYTAYRLADLKRSGARLAFGSDGPVSSVDPRYGLQGAIHRTLPGRETWYPEQRLSFNEALKGYTSGAAEAAGWRDCGRLELGFLADLVVWERGLEESTNFLDASVNLTVSGGKVVFRAP